MYSRLESWVKPVPLEHFGYNMSPTPYIVFQQPHGSDSSLLSVCPPGLQYLTSLDTILVHQKHEIFEILTGWETKNKYDVKDAYGEIMFKSFEQSKWYTRNLLRSLRPFDINIYDNYENQVIQLTRNFACQSCFCYCCLQVLRVCSPPGVLIGGVEQCWSLRPYFEIKDEFGIVQMIVKKGFISLCKCCSNIVYKVYLADGLTQIGNITKEGNCKKCIISILSDADDFVINFPKDLDVKLKTLLLGACFLIDFMYYENTEMYSVLSLLKLKL